MSVRPRLDRTKDAAEKDVHSRRGSYQKHERSPREANMQDDTRKAAHTTTRGRKEGKGDERDAGGSLERMVRNPQPWSPNLGIKP